MRCTYCGWTVNNGACPCGRSSVEEVSELVPPGTRVLCRAGRGPSILRWDPGEVTGHIGKVHRVETSFGVCWCEADDLLPDSEKRRKLLEAGARVWARWPDGRWFPGTIDAIEEPLRHVTWDDGDSMWIEASHAVLMPVESAEIAPGRQVIASRWDGERQLGIVEEEEGSGLFRVRFLDGEEASVSGGELRSLPPNPFREAKP